MHEIRAEETTRLKIGELDFGVGNIWKNENGKIVARIHPSRKSELYDELGEYFDFNEGDTFRIGKHTYLIDKIVKGRELENGRHESGHILIRKQ